VPRDRGRGAPSRPVVLALALIAASGVRAADEVLVEVKDPLVRVRAELDLFVNGAPGGPALVILERGDALVHPDDLERAGLAGVRGVRVTIDDRELVSLGSLAPAIRFEVDERALALRITTTPEYLGRHDLDLRPRFRPADLEERLDPSAFLNYAADSDLAGHVGLTFEAGGRVGRWLATSGWSRGWDGRWVRGMTAAVRDDVARLERLTVGDTVADSGGLGGAALLGGVSLGREFTLDPYLQRAPLPALSTIVNTPSRVEVYVNGSLVRQQQLAPGYWNLTNLPGPAGQTDLRAVVRDAFGREQTLDTRYYVSSGLLAAGLSDWGVAAGLRRENLGSESFDYGAPVALARYRVGWSDWFTPGVHAEASSDVVSVGGSATLHSMVGDVEGSAAASGAGGEAGSAGQLSWTWLAPVDSASARVTVQSARYANLSFGPAANRALVATEVLYTTSVRRLGLGFSAQAGRSRDLGPYVSGGARASTSLGAGFSAMLSVDYGRDAGGPLGAQVLALLTWGRDRTTADAGVTRDRGGHATRSASAARSLGREDGLGFRVHASGDDRSTAFDGTLQGQASFGRADLQVLRSDGATAYHASAAGGVVYIDRSLFLSRPTDGSFALVSTGPLQDIGVTADNTPVGSTSRGGRLLVTDLRSYSANRLAIREGDVPADYELGRTFRLVAPPLRGGAVVAFDLRRISAIAGQLGVAIRGQDARPGNGELSTIVDGDLRTSPITEDGRFFLERMPPGKHVLQAVWGGGSCRAVVTLPEKAPSVFDVGEVRCILDTLDPSGRLPSLRDPGYGVVPVEPETGAGSGGR
jgi:outer membrane usher protein